MNAIKRNLLLGVSAAAATAAIAVPALAMGFGSGGDDTDSEKFRWGARLGDRPAQHANFAERQAAIEAGDYAAWAELVDGQPIADLITEDNFARFVEMHELMRAGDWAAARDIRAELGMTGRGPPPGANGMRGGHGRGSGLGKDGQGPRFQDKNGDGYCDNLDRAEE